MTESTAPTSDVQLNLGGFSRISGRDYIEINAPRSVKVFLATTPSAELDALALDNEGLFRYRFGFHANPSIRAQIIAIKHQYSLTDDEIRSLRYSGQLRIRRQEAKIAPDQLVPAIGWFYILGATLMCACLVMALHLSSAPAWKQGLGLSMTGVLWLVSVWCASKVHITPWHLLKQVGAFGKANT